MTKIYLIRHAEAEGNLYRIIQGHMDSAVTLRGKTQIDALAERFRDTEIDALYTSDLRRTVETATAITRYHDVQMQKTERLREICMGVYEGMSFGDLRHKDPVQMNYFNNDPEKWRAEGAETFTECTERIFSAVKEIAEENDGKTVAVVSHGFSIRSFLSKLMGVKSCDIRTKLPHGDNTSVSLLYYENGEFKVEYCNDNSHLSNELSTFSKQTWWRVEANGKDLENLRYEPLNPYTQGDLYTDCYAGSWIAAHGNLCGFSPAPYLEDAKKHYDRDKRSIIAAYSGDEFIGIVEKDSSRGRITGYGWISLIYLLPEHRGKGRGIQLLGRAITDYQLMGRKSVRLHVSSENKNAIGFYEHYGFETLSTAPGCGAPLLLMEKTF